MLGLTACSSIEKLLPRYSDNQIKNIHLAASDDVNQSTPVAVDVVFLFDDILVTQVAKYTARKWFEEKLQLQLQNPDKFVTFSYELVPGAQAVLTPAKEKKKFPEAYQKALMVMAFANYLDESEDYTINLTPMKNPELLLGQRKITLKDAKK
ncbi:MAG: hypothetical protein AAF431_03745 [Pseudomonadota bacterium]